MSATPNVTKTVPPTTQAAPTASSILVNMHLQTPAPAPEDTYQQYTSVRHGIRIITDKGIRCSFAGGDFVTKDPDVIAYFNEELSKQPSGLPGIAKGELLTTSDLDPMEKLRKKFFAEFQAQADAKKAALALGQSVDMGTTPDATNIGAVNSGQTAS